MRKYDPQNRFYNKLDIRTLVPGVGGITDRTKNLVFGHICLFPSLPRFFFPLFTNLKVSRNLRSIFLCVIDGTFSRSVYSLRLNLCLLFLCWSLSDSPVTSHHTLVPTPLDLPKSRLTVNRNFFRTVIRNLGWGPFSTFLLSVHELPVMGKDVSSFSKSLQSADRFLTSNI